MRRGERGRYGKPILQLPRGWSCAAVERASLDQSAVPWLPWVPKLLAEWRDGNLVAVIALATTRVTTAKYFAPLVAESSAILKMEGRIQFWGPRAAIPDEGHELYYFGDDVAGFERHFAPFGKIFHRT
jgi:hypothetical protein